MPNSIPSSADITRHVLPNGIMILVRENFDAQSVVITGAFAGGATFEPSAKRGLAAITADALLRGTAQHEFHDLHEILESGGMSLDFQGGRLLTSFDGKALGEDFPMLVNLLVDVLRNPTFPEDHVDLIKGELITGLRYNEQNPRYMADKAFRQLAYPEQHIYHHGSSGEIETVTPITADDLRAYHTQQYGPGRMIITVVGAVKAQDAVKILEDMLGDWANNQQQTDWSQPALSPLENIQYQAVVIPGKTQNDIVMGVPGPSRLSADYRAATVINNIFGVFGMMGRLGENIREKQGLAYYCYSSVEGGLEAGAWKIAAGVDPKDAQKAFNSMRVELERILQTPISEEEINDNKSNLIARLPLKLETNEGVAANLMTMERYDLGLDYLLHYADEINALTMDDLQNAMHKYWNADAFSLAIAGPAVDIEIL